MKSILVFAEHQGGRLKRSTLELLSFASSKTPSATVALLVGEASEGILKELGAAGATQIHHLQGSHLQNYNPESWTPAVAEAVQKLQPGLVLASASSIGKDLFPRVAARLDTGVASDCIEIRIDGEQVFAKKPLYSGKCFAEVSFQNSAFPVVLMRANQLVVKESDPSKSASVQSQQVSPPADLKTQIKEIVKGTSERLDLTEANIIVSGGRGLKEAGNFKLLHDLADVLGATVGASRAVVDAGWVSHGLQVGQTGKTVAPSLYIAVGISGAIQHLAGMGGSKVIVAINSDPNAPIFQKATYGIVGDLFEVLPRLTEEFKKALNA